MTAAGDEQSEFERTLRALQAHVDGLGIELHDPGTPVRRVEQIKTELRQILQMVKDFVAHYERQNED